MANPPVVFTDDGINPIEMPLKAKYLIGGKWPKSHTAKPRTGSRGRGMTLEKYLYLQWKRVRHSGEV